ncbi:MAG: UDP-N-acetylglucosamine 1-carboxyvinyltransferase [Clostridia bacterium]|nr:UDP-N-acetylglucosamine 1-carboxyvinyltransferase [Clostridia bacterium]
METLYINGGSKLHGDIDIATAKNAILPILAGAIMSEGVVELHKVTPFLDVVTMLDILDSLGCRVEKYDDTVVIDSSSIYSSFIKEEYTKLVRSSIFMLGPLLTRLKRARVAYPGGCNIGNRPIDLHLKGLSDLNVKIEEKHGFIECDGTNMKAGDVHLDFPSVGATENIMMASVLLKGTTVIYNAAREPEIEDLQNFLNSMGAKVYGAGTTEIVIRGVDRLYSTSYTPISDRIIAGTYMIACAMTGGEICLKNVDFRHNIALINKLKQAGIKVKTKTNNIIVESRGKPRNISVETLPYPGFPTDLQNQLLTLTTISKGTSIITENLYESRLKICHELSKMGANIAVKNRMAIVTGVDKLYGASVEACDLRCGASLVLAGLVAEGYTIVHNIEHIDRGYLHIEEDLCRLNAEIRRIDKQN